jgi:glutamate-ammonia-ligase adenylyltransferase
LSPTLVTALPALLAESPDPDSAVMLFERLIASPEILRLIEQHHSLAHYAVVVFGHSRFLGETLLQNTDLLTSLLRDKNLDRSFSREEFHEALARFRSRSFETDNSLLFARFKRREYIRILLRDVLKIAPLAETTAEISALADVLIEQALREAETRLLHRYDPPQHTDGEGRFVTTAFAILALGKLGGSELNYSSDIDLMFLFGDGEAPPQAAISNREFFVRLAQQVTEILSKVTPDGPVYRLDLRLRPQGGEGELAISLSHALHYYAHDAHDWERQALIKVRCAAGSAALARKFIRSVQPDIYTERINFAAIKTALMAREKMHARRHQLPALEFRGGNINVKVDRGGIRDIEFLVQCLQRVYGGAEPWLRAGGTLFSLQKLYDKHHLTGKEFHDLTSAYEFLRHLEHRLQLRLGQQTHRLPVTESGLRIVHRAMEGYVPGQIATTDLISLVQQRMRAVAEIYHRIIYDQQVRQLRGEVVDAPFELRGLIEPGVADQSHQQILASIATDSPALHQIISHANLSLHGRGNLFRFLWSAFSTSERYATVLRHPEAVNRALALFENSEYLTEILVRHTEEIVTLSDLAAVPASAGSGYLFEESFGLSRPSGDPIFSYLADSHAPYGDKLAMLRQQYRHRILAAGARDILERRDLYTCLATTTAAAEDAIATAFTIAGAPDGLAVMALGRLGSGEFDVLSDADLLFICREENDARLLRTAEQIMQALAAYTQNGMVFSVDTRLRPRGGEGELLVTPSQLALYFKREAHPWEALMYTKLRHLVGSKSLGAEAKASTGALFERFAADSGFKQAMREMRSKLEAADASMKSFKTSPGGIYDIDFLTAYLLVRHGITEKNGSLRDRLWRCVAARLLEKSDAATLDHAAELLRTTEHVVRLVVGRARKWLPATEHAFQATERLVEEILGREFAEGLEPEILRSFAAVRHIFDRVLPDAGASASAST